MKVPVGIDDSASGSIHDEELPRPDIRRRWKSPFGPIPRIIGEVPAAEIISRVTRVEDFNPIITGAGKLIGDGIPAIGVVAISAIVGGHEFVDRQITHLKRGEGGGRFRPSRAGGILGKGPVVVGRERTESVQDLREIAAPGAQFDRVVPASRVGARIVISEIDRNGRRIIPGGGHASADFRGCSRDVCRGRVDHGRKRKGIGGKARRRRRPIGSTRVLGEGAEVISGVVRETEKIRGKGTRLRAHTHRIIPGSRNGASVVITEVDGDVWSFPACRGHTPVEIGFDIAHAGSRTVHHNRRIGRRTGRKGRGGICPIIAGSIAHETTEEVGRRGCQTGEVGSKHATLGTQINGIVPAAR